MNYDMLAKNHHDSISFISPQRAQAAINSMPIPVGMFMNMSNMPSRFYNKHHQAVQAVKQGKRPAKGSGVKSQERSSILNTNSYLTPLTQNQQNMTQPGYLSQQSEFSQISQADGMLSQDSNFQVNFGDKMNLDVSNPRRFYQS